MSKKIYIIIRKKVAFYFRVWVRTKSRYKQKLDDARKTHAIHVNHLRLDDLYTPVKCHHEYKFKSIPYMKSFLFFNSKLNCALIKTFPTSTHDIETICAFIECEHGRLNIHA